VLKDKGLEFANSIRAFTGRIVRLLWRLLGCGEPEGCAAEKLEVLIQKHSTGHSVRQMLANFPFFADGGARTV
jgi:hypothetical protein